MFQLRSLSAETRARKNLGSDKCQSLREGVISVDWSVVTIEIHKRPGRAECHPVFTFVNLLLWLVVLNIGPTRRKNTRQSTVHFCLHFTISGGDTFSCYLPKLIFSFTFLPLPFIPPSFSSCLLFFFLWIFLLASPPTDI